MGLVFLVVLSAAGIAALVGGLMGRGAEGCEPPRPMPVHRGCETCRYGEVLGSENPCSECCDQYPKLPMWEEAV